MYAIMRSQKHKAGGGLTAALQHMYRERETPNADRTIQNMDAKGLAKGTHESLKLLHGEIKRITDSTGRKVRKDAVVAVEYLLTASPEWWDGSKEQQTTFAKAATQWIKDTYPDGKILAASMHLDETTPHLSIFVTPTVKDSLNAKHFLGGRKLLRDQQDSFASAMAKFGLTRGVKGSKATHQQVSKFYSKVLKSQEKKEELSTEIRKKIDKNSGVLGSKKALVELSHGLAEQLTDTMSSISYQEVERLRAENARLREREQDMRGAIEGDIKREYFDQFDALQRAHDQRLSEADRAQKTIHDYETLIQRIEPPTEAYRGLSISPPSQEQTPNNSTIKSARR